MFLLLALLIHVAPDQKTASDVSHTVVLKLSDAPARDVAVTLDLVSPERTWSVPVKVKGKLEFTFVHPPCDCTLRARAGEYAEVTRPLGNEISLLLRRLPVIRGIVLDRMNAAPLAGAEVALPGTRTMTTTDERGAFRIVVDGAWPTALHVDYPLRAPALVPVPRVIADTDLPPIHLTLGGAIQIGVAPPVGGSENLSWEIRKDDKSAALVRSGELAAGASSARIESLEPGTYRVLLKGSEPLQRYMGKAKVIDRVTTEANVAIAPVALEGIVTFGDEPLASASVVFRPDGYGWSGEVTTDQNGRFSEELWQTGAYQISVTREPLVRIWGTDRELKGEGHLEVRLDVPNRRVRGRVMEASTGKPVGDAVVYCEMKFGEHGTIHNRVRSADDGSFEFAGVEAGTVTLRVQKPGYTFERPIAFVLGEDETTHEERLVLEELSAKRTVVVTDARGIPIAGAEVFAPGDGPDGLVDAATTDEQGRATIPLASPEQRGMVFVIPRSGSVGYASLAGDGDLLIRVLDTAMLDLRIENMEGEPIPRVIVRMSINGLRIPAEILAMMAHLQGTSFYSDASGRIEYLRMPPGLYELWPIASKKDSLASPPAVRVSVLPGPQTVVMKFKPK